jgi:hypothetical protein
LSGKRLTRATASQSGGNVIQPKKKLRKDSRNRDQGHLEEQKDDDEKNVGFSLVNYLHSIF